MSQHVVEKLKGLPTSHVLVVEGTIAVAMMQRLVSADGNPRWQVTVAPEDRCPIEPLTFESRQVTPRAVAEEAAETFHKAMRGEGVTAPTRDKDEALLAY